MILPIYLYGSPVLKQRAADADLNDKEGLTQLISNMKETMKNADGCGLAAPQVGQSIRVLVVNGDDLAETYPDLKGFSRTMINPVILEESEETSEYNEGCLSLPNLDAEVIRPRKITVRYFNEEFNEVEESFDDFASRMIQHEYDHLEGIVYTDRISPIRKKMIQGKLRGISKGCVRTSYRVKVG